MENGSKVDKKKNMSTRGGKTGTPKGTWGTQIFGDATPKKKEKATTKKENDGKKDTFSLSSVEKCVRIILENHLVQWSGLLSLQASHHAILDLNGGNVLAVVPWQKTVENLRLLPMRLALDQRPTQNPTMKTAHTSTKRKCLGTPCQQREGMRNKHPEAPRCTMPRAP